MGIFDTYIDHINDRSIQLKVQPSFATYKLGCRVLIPDGMYFAPEGIVIINDNKFVAAFGYEQSKDKWDNDIGSKLCYLRENICGQKDIFKNMHGCLERNKNED